MPSDNFQRLAETTALIAPIRHYSIVNTRLFGAVVAVDLLDVTNRTIADPTLAWLGRAPASGEPINCLRCEHSSLTGVIVPYLVIESHHKTQGPLFVLVSYRGTPGLQDERWMRGDFLGGRMSIVVGNFSRAANLPSPFVY
jgi:hypothetical protein